MCDRAFGPGYWNRGGYGCRMKSRGLGPLVCGAVALGALAAAALNAYSARVAEQKYPPAGKFVEVDGVRLHYVERGTGSPIVLLHGNAVTAEDWELSGVFDRFAEHHRVIAFDRPGFGYSERPRTSLWGPREQAALLHRALVALGVVKPIVVAHSWATLVAVAIAQEYPRDVARLVLVSGYFFPTLRADTLPSSIPAVPLIGDILRYTVWPIVMRLSAPVLLHQMFAPAPVPACWLPLSMIVRPAQLRAAAEEVMTMVPSAALLQLRYGELTVPADVISGDADRIVDYRAQSERFARDVLRRTPTILPDAGHMVHYVAQETIVAAATVGPFAV